ncbi:hypothetical protein [Lacinutrix himadriensis]|uniref:hypothetical protein n=1 Tax=Lacinutrix himadriensis TaxID=641549 RepID=UPI0006E370EC|nr:hypothetical protein [Lacinutrix himadriensis]
MKTLLKLTFLLFFSLTNAQFSETALPEETKTFIGYFNNFNTSHGSLRSEIVDGTKIYTLKYGIGAAQNFIIRFEETGNDLESLYQLLSTFFIKENKKDEQYVKSFKLGEVDVICTGFGGIPFHIYFKTEDGVFYISERQLDKLFGKR